MIAPWAFGYVGLPYEEGSWGPDTFDCWGLMAEVYRNVFCIDLLSSMQSYDRPGEKILRLQEHVSAWNRVDKPRIGDGALFLVNKREPHCGIYVGDGRILHSIKNVSSCIQEISAPKWKPRLDGFYRHSSSNS